MPRPVGPPGEVAPGKRDRPQTTINQKPRMGNMRNTPHWVDRSVWTEVCGAVIRPAPLVLCPIEREVRRDHAPEYDMTGFYVNDGRACGPTGGLILQSRTNYVSYPAIKSKAPPFQIQELYRTISCNSSTPIQPSPAGQEQ